MCTLIKFRVARACSTRQAFFRPSQLKYPHKTRPHIEDPKSKNLRDGTFNTHVVINLAEATKSTIYNFLGCECTGVLLEIFSKPCDDVCLTCKKRMKAWDREINSKANECVHADEDMLEMAEEYFGPFDRVQKYESPLRG